VLREPPRRVGEWKLGALRTDIVAQSVDQFLSATVINSS
jgi:hypothetical protein